MEANSISPNCAHCAYFMPGRLCERTGELVAQSREICLLTGWWYAGYTSIVHQATQPTEHGGKVTKSTGEYAEEMDTK